MTNTRRRRPFRPIGVDEILVRAARRRIVVIAPHPDDETLGCGSLIARAARRGIGLAVIALTDGGASHPQSHRWPPALLGPLRAGEMRRALARLGAGDVPIRRLAWRDSQVVADGSAAALRRQLVALRAGIVLVTSDADHHPDHQAAYRLARAAGAALRRPVIRYAVWSRADAPVSGIVRLAGAKRWAIKAHRSQLGGYITDDPSGFSLSPSALGSFVRGAERFEE